MQYLRYTEQLGGIYLKSKCSQCSVFIWQQTLWQLVIITHLLMGPSFPRKMKALSETSPL